MANTAPVPDGGAPLPAAAQRQPALALPPMLFGTMPRHDRPPDAVGASVNAALAGWRGIDSAEAYGRDAAARVAEALAAHRQRGGGGVFVCTKLRGLATEGLDDPEEDYAAVRGRTQSHLDDLGVATADLLLMHWPGHRDCDLGDDPAAVAAASSWAYFDANVDRAWRNMLRLKRNGLCRHVGVSNFYKSAWDRLVAGVDDGDGGGGGGVVGGAHGPEANQLFIDAAHPEFDTVHRLQSQGVAVMAYRPVAFLPAAELAGQMGDGLWANLAEAAAAAGATSVHQFVLAWLVKRGVCPVVSASDPSRAASNLDAAALPDHAAYERGCDLFRGGELLDAVGCGDDYAAVFSSVGPPASA